MLRDLRQGREGLHRHRVRASPAGRDEWGRDIWVGREPEWSCASACRAAAPAAELVQEPDGSAVAAGAPPYRGAEARWGARPVVRRDWGAAAGAKASQELATLTARMARQARARMQMPGERTFRSERTEQAAGAPCGPWAGPGSAAARERRGWATARVAGGPTEFDQAAGSEPGALELDRCVWADAAARRRRATMAASKAQACCVAVLPWNCQA
jgi:hypothetical protein